LFRCLFFKINFIKRNIFRHNDSFGHYNENIPITMGAFGLIMSSLMVFMSTLYVFFCLLFIVVIVVIVVVGDVIIGVSDLIAVVCSFIPICINKHECLEFSFLLTLLHWGGFKCQF
jgi:hypothetical protein